MHNIAIISYNYDKYSETFIHNLVKHLPFRSHYLYGGELPEYDGNRQKFLSEKGFDKVIIALKEWVGVSRYTQHQQAVEKYLLKHEIKAIHANYAITAFPLMDICLRNNIPLIVHFRGWTAYRSTTLEKYRKDYDHLFDMAKAVVCVSHDMKKQLMSLGCPENKIQIIPSGANTEIFTYSDHSANPPVFLSAGRFCDTKNPHLSILAFSKALKQIPEAKLIMVGGDENLLCACVSLCKALKVEDKVIFKGVVTQQEIFELMKNSLAYVQHSAVTILNEKEGTPNSVMEACSSGLVVIATRHAGIMDVIIEEETGLLCNEFDVDAMAANMVRVAKDRALANKMGMQASKRVGEHFTMKQCIEKLSAVIEQAISK
ncbi:MAG: glycosyltransferase family 4 protein [Bacteroidota bacterium]